ARLGPGRAAVSGTPRELHVSRLPQPPPRPISGGVAPELDQPRLAWVQPQPEPRQPLTKLNLEPPRIILVFEPDNKVVSETHDDDLATRVARAPPLNPQVQDIVQVDIRQQRRYRRPLRRAFLIRSPFPVLNDSRSQPLTNQPQDPPVRDPMLEKLPQPRMIKLTEKVADIRIKHPAHRLAADPDHQRVQRIMRTTLGPKPIRETPEIHLVHGIEYLDQRPLNNLVLQHGDPPAAAAARLPCQIYARLLGLARYRPDCTRPCKSRRLARRFSPVLGPGHPIDTRRGLRANRLIGLTQPPQRDMVQQRGEPRILIPTCYLTHTAQRTRRTKSGTESPDAF